MSDPQLDPQFEAMGKESVRAMLGTFQAPVRSAALIWLAQRESDERSRNEASQSLQMRVARSANLAAWIAAPAAIIAAIAAIVTVVLEWLKK